MHAIVVTYRVEPGRKVEHAELCRQLAPAFAAAPGLISATWLENARTGRSGAFFVFTDRDVGSSFIASELFARFGAEPEWSDKTTQEFDINEPATAITGAMGGSR